MKKMNICFFCILAVLCTTLNLNALATEPKSQEDDKAYLALVNLGIMEKSEDFNWDKMMTRAEFARVASIISYGGNVPRIQESKYTDITPDSEYFIYINAVVEAGLMNGKSEKVFGGDQLVSLHEVCSVMVNILGYQIKVESSGGFLTGYVEQAAQLRILKGINLNQKELSTRDVISIIYHALDTDVMEMTYQSNPEFKVKKELTLLKKNFRIDKISGIFFTAIAAGIGSSSRDKIVINGVAYRTNQKNTDCFNGYLVNAYICSEQNEDIVIHIEGKGKTEMLSIDADSISGYENYKLSYEENNRNKSAAISRNVVIMYNGIVMPTAQDSYFTPREGYAELIDNDADRVYDVIRIFEQDIMVVGSVNLNEGKIYDFYDKGKTLNLGKDQEKQYTIMNGKDIYSLDTLSQYDILTINYPKNGDNISINVSFDYVYGVFDEVAEDYVVIDGTNYGKASNYGFINNNVKLQEKAFFHLDMYGRVAAVERENSNDKKYGYFIDIGEGKSGFDNLQIKFMNYYGEMEIHSIADTTYVNGEAVKSPKLSNANLLTTALMTQQVKDSEGNLMNIKRNFFVRQPILYAYNDKGQIDYIDTSIMGSRETEDNLKIDNIYTQGITYKSWPKVFGDSFGVNDDALIFYIPKTENSVDNSGNLMNNERTLLDDKNYMIRTQSFFNDNSTYSNLVAYDVSDGGIAKMVICYYTPSSSAVTALQESGVGIAVVDKIVKAVNNDGEEVSKMYLYYKSVLAGYYVANEDIFKDANGNPINLQRGDIIQVNFNGYDEITNLCFRFKSRSKEIVTSDGTSDIAAIYRGRYGVIYSKDSKGIRINENGSLKTFMLGTLNRILVYNVADNTIRQGTKDDFIDRQTSLEDASYVYIQTVWGAVANIVIIK